MKTVAVIGGSGGLGSCVAQRIGRDRPVFVSYRSNPAKAREIVTGLRAQGFKADCGYVDLLSIDSVQAFLHEAAAFGEGLGGVVSASGAPFPMCALVDASEQELRNVTETEMFGTFRILKCAVPMLKKEGGGAIVLFLTTAVLRTMDYDGLNSVPKAAIAMMVRHVARESGRDNVRVNGIAPGVIDAGRTDIVSQLPPIVQQVVGDCLKNTPLPRLGRPAEVSALAAYLVSEDAGYVSGQIIGLDGGYSA